MVRCLILLMALLSGCSARGAADHGVILLYHHVDESTPASTSVSPATFERHLVYLEENGYTVWPLGRLLDTLAAAEPVPEKTVAITFDDAYVSIYREAFPRLKRRDWPFTIFVNTEAVDSGYAQTLSWQQLREMAGDGAEIGNHSHSHGHLVRRRDGETLRDWAARVGNDIDTAAERLAAELGGDRDLFAYPFGEYHEPLRTLVEERGYRGIAQQSGAVGPGFDKLAVPRFPLAGRFAEMDRFATAVRSRPLPAKAVDGGTIVRRVGDSGGELRLDFAALPFGRGALNCFTARGERLPVAWRGGGDQSVARVTLPEFRTAGRAKVNCTAPVSGEPGEYYWYSHQWLVRKADGSWYRE